ncbi:MAG: PqqD family protein [Chlorobi bacterium]|nr:PqqD family protein [Chlorobiota bacterium]
MFGKSKNAGNEIDYMELTPHPNYAGSRRDDGMIDVLVPKFKNKFARKYINHRMKSPYIKANLDELGSAVWEKIDGKNKVREIADSLKHNFGDDVEQLQERLTRYLTQLYNAGFISFIELKKGRKHG